MDVVAVGNQLQPRPFVRQPCADHAGLSVVQTRHTVVAVHQPVGTRIKRDESLPVRSSAVAQHDADTALFKMMNRLQRAGFFRRERHHP